MPADYTNKEYIIKVNDEKSYILTEFAKELQRALVNNTTYNVDTDTLEIVIPPGLSIVSQVTNSNGDVTTVFSDGTRIVVPEIIVPDVVYYDVKSTDGSVGITKTSAGTSPDVQTYDLSVNFPAVPEGLTIISQQTEELGTYTTFSDGTIIFVPRAPVIPSYTIVSSDNSIDVEPTFDGANTSINLSANFPAGLSVVSQLHYGAGTATTFSDGTVIYVPDAVEAAVYTHWSPDGSVIIEQDDVNKTVTYEVAKTSEPTVTEHITSVIEQAFAVDGQTEISDLNYIQRAGTIDASGAALWPIADIELMVFADASVAVALEADNPNSYSSLIHEDTLADGVFIKARLFGDILTNLPTTWKVMATGSGNVISPSHYLVHRWMGVVVPPEPLLVVGSMPEDLEQDTDLTIPFIFTLNTTDFNWVDEDLNSWVMEIQAVGDTSKTVLSYEKFTKTDNKLTSIDVTLLHDTEYIVTFLENKLVRSNGQMNQEYVVNIKTKYVKPVNYTLDGNYFGGAAIQAIPVTIKDYDTQAVVEVIPAGDWASAEKYLPNVINTVNGGFSNWEDTSPDYDFVLPKCVSIGDNFLFGTRSFNSNISAPVCKTIGVGFRRFGGGRSEIVPWNRGLVLPAIESIGNYFLNDCRAYNQPLDLSNVTTIGDYFLSNCQAYNQPLDLSNVTTIGNYFLDNCRAYNQVLDLSNVTTIGDRFLSNCQAYNQVLDLSNVTTIGDHFMLAVDGYSSLITAPVLTSMGAYFFCSLNGASVPNLTFNAPFSFPALVTIGDHFLDNCQAYNQVLDLSNVTTIGNYFLSNCRAYNQVLDLSNVTTIGNYFLSNCRAYNQVLDLSNVTTIGNYFLDNCRAYNVDLWVPSGVDTNGFINNGYNSPVKTNTITFDGVIVLDNWYFFYNSYCNNFIFTKPQIITTSNRFFNLSYSINLTIPASSAGLDLSNPTQPKWCGARFKSITLT